MAHKVTVAVAQLDAVLADVSQNVRRARDAVVRAAAQGASLVVLPECYLTGYVTKSREQAQAIAIPIDGVDIAEFTEECRQQGVYAVVGLLERADSHVYNSVAVVGPGGLIGVYRKRHLPYMGADRFATASEETEPQIFDTEIGRIGIAICYEIRFPEVMRTLALEGAEIIALPTNWPVQASILADHFTRVRAAENLVYLLVANRGDSEEGVQFLGGSQIVDPLGNVMTRAGSENSLLVREIDVDRSRDKTITFEKGEFELSPWKDRRPAAYRL